MGPRLGLGSTQYQVSEGNSQKRIILSAKETLTEKFSQSILRRDGQEEKR